VLRIDREPAAALPTESAGEVARRLALREGALDALVVSDYGYGAVGDELAAVATALATAGTTVVLDPRRRVEGFRGVTALTPNVGELALLVGSEPARLAEPAALHAAACELLARTHARFLLVTRGNLGMGLWGAGLPARGVLVAASGAGNVTDVSGAGDTVAAVFALALAAGSEPVRAMELANAAAGVVVMENGTATCSAEALRAALPLAPAPTRAPAGGGGGTP